MRARVGERYSSLLGSMVRVPNIAEGNTSVYAQYTIEVDDRDTFCAAMQAQGIPTAVHYPTPLHLQPAFASLKQPIGSFSISEAAGTRVVSLPMHPYLDTVQQDEVIAAVQQALRR